MTAPNRRTFSHQSPADLYGKLDFEALEIRGSVSERAKRVCRASQPKVAHCVLRMA
ncbi:hypothetical protein SAMN05192564_106258 [Paraburkholderia sartisoli]|uniref:Uncharacterized protein n=1 Tax=Paraburkholderia sartisoli TaxID=83784 RepID=A0A1H4GQL1_9BURK|nr:hypothetical protein SAMN05192564_106258 [Paraburkholderia sartisoli]